MLFNSSTCMKELSWESYFKREISASLKTATLSSAPNPSHNQTSLKYFISTLHSSRENFYSSCWRLGQRAISLSFPQRLLVQLLHKRQTKTPPFVFQISCPTITNEYLINTKNESCLSVSTGQPEQRPPAAGEPSGDLLSDTTGWMADITVAVFRLQSCKMKLILN